MTLIVSEFATSTTRVIFFSILDGCNFPPGVWLMSNFYAMHRIAVQRCNRISAEEWIPRYSEAGASGVEILNALNFIYCHVFDKVVQECFISQRFLKQLLNICETFVENFFFVENLLEI